MKILHLDSSINHEFSVTRQLTAEIVKQLMASGQEHQLTYRDLVKDEISHLTGEIASGFRPVSGRPTATASLASEQQVSDALISEFLESETIVKCFSISQRNIIYPMWVGIFFGDMVDTHFGLRAQTLIEKRILRPHH